MGVENNQRGAAGYCYLRILKYKYTESRNKNTLTEIEQSIELAWPNYGQMLHKNVSRKSSEKARNQSFTNKSVDRSHLSNTGYDLKIETSTIIDPRKGSPLQSKNLKLKSGTIVSKEETIPSNRHY